MLKEKKWPFLFYIGQEHDKIKILCIKFIFDKKNLSLESLPWNYEQDCQKLTSV